MSFIPEIEKKSTLEIKKFQEERLRELLQYLITHSPYYKKLFIEHQIDASQIKSLEDLQKLPVTTKDDIQNNNWEFLCIEKNAVAEFTATSGTLGNPVTIALSRKDLERLAYNEYISFCCANGTAKDCYQLMLTLDRQFMAGIAYYEGIRKLGATVVRVGPGLPQLQLESIQSLNPTVLVAVPSFLVKLIEFAGKENIDLNQTSVRSAVCIGESIRSPELGLSILAKKILDGWNIKLYNTYASTEMQTAFTECSAGTGGHLHPELIIVELLDDNNMPVEKGSPGEVTITTLGVEAMPLLRYKTGDISVAYDESCSCGRNTLRLGPVIGRKQEMIKLKGTTIYPPGIFNIMSEVDFVKDYAVEVITNELGTDELRIHIEADSSNKNEFEQKLKSIFKSRLRVVPEIILTSQNKLFEIHFRGNSRKVKRFLDNRK
ncbi:MAG TPA: AMP-binding protein [Cyclobacteriaceae bacterium]|jgi:phenylacetate-CoA ligase